MWKAGPLPPTMQTLTLATLVLAVPRWISGRPTRSQQPKPLILAPMMHTIHALEMHAAAHIQQTIMVATATPMDVTSTVTIKVI